MFDNLLAKMFGTHHDRQMKRLQPIIDKINSLEPGLKELSDEQLKAKTPEFRERLASGETTDDIMPEAFAVCREASIRVLGMRPYDVQLIGGITLFEGSIAEMRTGEGKTLVATLPTYLMGLTQKGVHIVTVNDYLAERDSEWMGRLYKWLGLSVGLIIANIDDTERKEAYGADITYGTNNEFGFDYLRDNMKYSLDDYVQRPHHYAIVDECDSILIDEARTPLIISGPAEEGTEKYVQINKLVPHLKLDVHFTMEEKSKSVSLTEEGNSKAEELLGVKNVYDPQNIELIHHIYQALKAHYLFKIDVDYMIKAGEIVIVDEFTGRLMDGRRWSDGLHQAVEAKEGLKVKSENQTLASVTFQNYFRMYDRLSGMTGTADTEAVEFRKIYKLEVFVIPTNKPIQRLDSNDVIFKTEDAKFNAIAKDIKVRVEKGQPVLVGTVSIERSERISAALKRHNISHNVLNAKHHEREAEIISQAGSYGAVTIATNMAGRGTDIVLGGNAEALAKQVNTDTESTEFKTAFEKFNPKCEADKVKVLDAGGLYIIGTERHESRRIDNQLRGRSGRQGDPGESKFYLSLEDDLMRIFNGERIQSIMSKLNVPDDEPIEAGMVSRAVENAQKKVEGHNFDIRKHLLEYDDVMNQQRNSIYTLRKRVLLGQGIDELVKEAMAEVSTNLLDQFAAEDKRRDQWDVDGLNTALNQHFGTRVKTDVRTSAELDELLQAAVVSAYDSQNRSLAHLFPQVKRMVLLRTLDQKWKEHLYSMDQLKEGINLRSFAQKDPLQEYKKEAYRMFEELDYTIKSDSIEQIFKIQIVMEDRDGNAVPVSDIDPNDLADEFAMEESAQMEYNNPEEEQARGFPAQPQAGNTQFELGGGGRAPEPSVETFVRDEEKVGRNDPCPCGSGKKFKKCHGQGS